MKRFAINMVAVALLMVASVASAEEHKATKVAQHLQDISVTIRAGGSQGSGVLISRMVKSKGKMVNINFVWTAAHVVDGLRSTRTIIGPNGSPKVLVEFRDVQILKEDQVDGRKVGEHVMDAKVVLYSDSEHGHDLALLMVRKPNFTISNAVFEPDHVCAVGTNLIHVGSLLGQAGSNSMTRGNVSQTGRVLQLGNGAGTLFDQTSCPAFPGSSGGGVFTAQGKYMGMLVRGAGETFNLVVPVRRMYKYARKHNVLWALDKSVPVPSLSFIDKINPEHAPTTSKKVRSKDSKKYSFLVGKLNPCDGAKK